MQALKSLCIDLMRGQHFSQLAVSIVDFKNKDFFVFESTPQMYFDLASLTKPLTLSAIYHKNPSYFDSDLLLLLNHKAGLPVGGRLSFKNWKEQILSYKIHESSTLYSDYSALRLMLELERKIDKDIHDLCSFYFDPQLKFWKEFFGNEIFAVTGTRHGEKIVGVVNDDNAFTLNQFCSHAGLFATISGLSQSLLNLDKKTSFVLKQEQSFSSGEHSRFLNGWDTVERIEKADTSLAGKGCSEKTFGHLGFTGTSIWIDSLKGRAVVILTNATEKFWYDRRGLNMIRREIGQFAWNKV